MESDIVGSSLPPSDLSLKKGYNNVDYRAQLANLLNSEQYKKYQEDVKKAHLRQSQQKKTK